MARSNPIVRPLLIALFSYLLTLGGFLSDPGVSFTSLLIITAVFGALLLMHLLRGWRWTRTPLDPAFAIWIIAIVSSLIANSGDWRRIVIGIWYTGIYILLWYIMHDLLANGALKKSMIVDSLLIGSIYMIAFGYFQLYDSAIHGWRYPSFLGLPRPVSLTGNTNLYASILILIVGLSAGRLIGLRSRFWRIVLAVYLLLTLVQLFLTFSRGGWLGAAAALGTAFIGWLWVNHLLSPAQLRAQWYSVSGRWRTGLAVAAAMSVVVIAIVGMVFVRSLDEPGRTIELRTYLWDVALQMFRQQPITGRGLFTYGKIQEMMVSIPPTTPHSHAHNLPLHILGELGLIGGAALVFSFIIVVQHGWRNLKRLQESNPASHGLAPTTEQGVFIAGLSVMIGLGVHLLFDTTVMMSTIAITGLIAILIVVYHPVSPLKPAWNRVFYLVYLVAGFGLLATGFLSNNIYRTYINIVKNGIRTEDYSSAARQLNTVTQADPQLAVYWWQQGMLYGLAADMAPADSEDADEAARSGLVALERVTEIEPQNAFTWANIAGLRRQLDDTSGALAAYRQASDLAPRSWQLALVWGKYAEDNNDLSQAQIAYARAISASPTAALHPAIANSPIGGPLSDGLALDGFDQVARLYLDGEYAAASAAWDADTAGSSPSARQAVLRGLIAYAMGDQTTAEKWLSAAKTRIFSDETLNEQWVSLGQAIIEEDNSALSALLSDSSEDPLQSGTSLAVALYRAQFERDSIAIEYLPQVGYEMHDPLLVRFISVSAAQTAGNETTANMTAGTTAPAGE